MQEMATRRFQTEGQRLLALAMAERNWTQADLESLLGVHSGAACRWLTGKRVPGLVWALKLEKAVGIDPASWHSPPVRMSVPPPHESTSAVTRRARRVQKAS